MRRRQTRGTILAGSFMLALILASGVGLEGVGQPNSGQAYAALREPDWNNTAPETAEAYRRFLAGEGTAVVADWFAPDVGYSGIDAAEIGKEYTLEQLNKIILSDKYDRWQVEYTGDTEYALLDSADDGEKELAVRLNSVGIGGAEDTSTTTLILKAADGKLLLCDAFDTWSRSESSQYYYGFRDGAGSAGAGDHIYDAAFIDGDGRKQQIYECETVDGPWMAYVNEEALHRYNERYEEMYPRFMSMEIYRIGGEEYVSYEIEFTGDQRQRMNDKKMFDALISCFEEQGVKFQTAEEIDGLIAGRKQALGIKEAWLEEKELNWQKFSNTP